MALTDRPAPRPPASPPAAGAARDTGFLPVIARWWWTLLAGALLAAGVSYAAASTATPTYEAKARVLVGPVNTDLNTLQASVTMSQTYAELIEDGKPIEDVSDEIGHGLGGAVQAVADVDTRIITIRVRERDQDEVWEVANALADSLKSYAEDEGGGAPGEVRLVEPAERPSQAFSPRIPLVVPIAGMAGLLLSLAVVLLLEYLGDTFRGSRDLDGLTGGTALGSLDGGEPLRPEDEGTAERLLAVKVAYGGGGADGARASALVVGVESGDEQEVATNLAVAAAGIGRRVVLLDADWRGTGATRAYGLHDLPGLGEALGAADVVEAARRSRVPVGPRLEVVPVGRTSGLRIVEPEVAEAIVAGLARDADLVLVASPPVAEEAAGLVWARAAEGVVLVARPEHTQREAVADALTGLSAVGATVLGVALNISRVARPVRDRPDPVERPARRRRGRRS